MLAKPAVRGPHSRTYGSGPGAGSRPGAGRRV